MINLFEPSSEHRAIRELANSFSDKELKPGAEERDRDERFDVKLFRRAGELGLLGALVPASYGGSEMDVLSSVIIHEELAASDAGFALAYLSHSILFMNSILNHGNDDQRADVLPNAVSGERIGCVAMSEANAGTDVMAMKTTARRESDAYILNGTKTWITNGCIDDSTLGDDFLVYAKTSEDKLRGLSLFLIKNGAPGFNLGGKIGGKLGMRSSNCAELVMDDCRIPEGFRFGPEGSGLSQMMKSLPIERLMLAAIGIGLARRCLEIMNTYASDRISMGKKIREYGQIQSYLSESYAEWQAARTYLYETASRMKSGQSSLAGLDADGVKLLVGGVAQRLCDRAVQVLGGNGYVRDFQVERMWRDARLISIGGGSSEALQRNMTRMLARKRRFA